MILVAYVKIVIMIFIKFLKIRFANPVIIVVIIAKEINPKIALNATKILVSIGLKA